MREEELLTRHHIRDQVVGVIVAEINAQRIQEETAQLFLQDAAFVSAVEQIDKIRKFVGSPENILGNHTTKHGEIAEHVEVGIRNARNALLNQDMTATFDSVGRTAPEDYIIEGLAVQSKFINGINNNLEHVLNHMDKYPQFGKDGSFYHIPKDTYDTITKILSNEQIENLSDKSIRAIKDKVAAIELESNRQFNDIVRPGISKYADVQQGKIYNTIEGYENELDDTNSKIKNNIHNNHQPTFGEAAKAAGMGAAVGGALTLTASMYKKYKQGKNPFTGDFSIEDWKDVGISVAKGSAGGAVAGAAIYGLTNYASLSAPFAGAVVSAAKSINSLVADYKSGQIDFETFLDLGMLACAESAIVGICTAAGQTLIPIPILGAVIGSIAGKMISQFTIKMISNVNCKIQQKMETFISKLDDTYINIVKKIELEFDQLGELTKAAFDFNNNKNLLKSSVDLARIYKVEESRIIKNHKELDLFILS